jgi:hypothetical protein
MIPLYHYQHKHPHNFVFLGLFTLCLSFSIGVACANTEGLFLFQCFDLFLWLSIVSFCVPIITYFRKNCARGIDTDCWSGCFFDCICLLGCQEGQGIWISWAFSIFWPYYPRPNKLYPGNDHDKDKLLGNDHDKDKL